MNTERERTKITNKPKYEEIKREYEERKQRKETTQGAGMIKKRERERWEKETKQRHEAGAPKLTRLRRAPKKMTEKVDNKIRWQKNEKETNTERMQEENTERRLR